MPSEFALPWLPAGHTMVIPGRGELFYRRHQHSDPGAPTVLLLHGWTASADLQFFTAYESLAARYSFIAIDHRGHGRGLRSPEPFELVDAADDAAELVRALGVGPVVTLGYSMGGPISLLLAKNNPELVRAMVVQATALEWRSGLLERVRWKTLHIAGPILRSWAYPRWLRFGIRRLLGPDHQLTAFVPWLSSEMRRNDAHSLVHAGQALSHFDGGSWSGQLDKPAGALITTRDRLVKPRQQRALAAALHAHVVEVDGDHITPWTHPNEFAAATMELLEMVIAG